MDNDNFTEEVLNFLNSHPALSVKTLEDEGGLPKNTLSNLKSRGGLNAKHFDKVANVLAKYGFRRDFTTAEKYLQKFQELGYRSPEGLAVAAVEHLIKANEPDNIKEMHEVAERLARLEEVLQYQIEEEGPTQKLREKEYGFVQFMYGATTTFLENHPDAYMATSSDDLLLNESHEVRLHPRHAGHLEEWQRKLIEDIISFDG